jgi:hypothetical protein
VVVARQVGAERAAALNLDFAIGLTAQIGKPIKSRSWFFTTAHASATGVGRRTADPAAAARKALSMRNRRR